jgi:F-box protein 18 (helicase)
MNWTAEQRRIIEYDFPKKTLIIEAYAGTGKTSTLLAFARYRTANVLYLCFNKQVRKEVKDKNIKNITPHTFNSLAYSYCKENIDEKLPPLDEVIDDRLTNTDEVSKWLMKKIFDKWLTKPHECFSEFADYYMENSLKHLDRYIPSKFRDKLQPYISGTKQPPKLPFGLIDNVLEHSQLYLNTDAQMKYYHLRADLLNYRYIIVDEAQDLSQIQIDIIRKQKEAFKVIVGDDFQSLYEWRGAVNAIKTFKDTVEHDLATLSQSFRCPEGKISVFVNRLLKQPILFKGVDTEEAEVSAYDDILDVVKMLPKGRGKVFITRKNSTILQTALTLAKNGYKFNVLESSTSIFSPKNIKQLLKEAESTTIEEARLGHKDTLVDFLTALPKIKEQFGDVGSFLELFESHKVRSNSKELTITLTNAFQAKGLEWRTVILANDFKSGMGLEDNLRYVSATRTKLHLYYPQNCFPEFDNITVSSEKKDIEPIVTHNEGLQKDGRFNLSFFFKPTVKEVFGETDITHLTDEQINTSLHKYTAQRVFERLSR